MAHRFIGFCVLGMLALPVQAELSGKGEAGLVVASGNTETETANAKVSLVHETPRWKNQFGLAGLYASDEDGQTAERWEATGQSDYNFNPETFVFSAGRYEQDEFSGFEYQATASIGIGRKFIDSAATKFVGTLGVGYKFLSTRDAFDDETGVLIEEGDSDKEAIVRGTLDYEYDFTPTTSILDKFIVESGADNTFVQNDISLQVKITDVLALAVGYSVRHNTQAPPDFEETDTLTTISLVYELK